ncbi:MAG: metal-binding protein [Zetaproteobacteria bacterium CG1_02_53_45]|nr:MAG: metal-binding protein [Zetaproteobacteria bacterium CG1_02_53_45]
MINLPVSKSAWTKLILASVALLMLACSTVEKVSATEIVMYKDPNCGCCGDWAKHLQAEGFTVTEKLSNEMERVKAEYGVPAQLASCHTAIVDGYIIEGHVPADDIKRLLKERPAVTGLTAPGMPMQSPGMQPSGLPPKGYDVLSFDKQGNSHVYHSYK